MGEYLHIQTPLLSDKTNSGCVSMFLIPHVCVRVFFYITLQYSRDLTAHIYLCSNQRGIYSLHPICRRNTGSKCFNVACLLLLFFVCFFLQTEDDAVRWGILEIPDNKQSVAQLSAIVMAVDLKQEDTASTDDDGQALDEEVRSCTIISKLSIRAT